MDMIDDMRERENQQAERRPSIFISHSSKDLVVARAARNLLEDWGHHTLILGLLLLDKRSDQDILEFIEAELRERDWLVYIDSENARASKYVEFELETARKYGKTFYTIDAHRFERDNRLAVEHAIMPCLKMFSRSIRLNIQTRGHADGYMLETYLKKKGYELSMDDDAAPDAWGLPLDLEPKTPFGDHMPLNVPESLDEAALERLINHLDQTRQKMISQACE